jgi:hypothetical protein
MPVPMMRDSLSFPTMDLLLTVQTVAREWHCLFQKGRIVNVCSQACQSRRVWLRCWGKDVKKKQPIALQSGTRSSQLEVDMSTCVSNRLE